MVYIRLRLQVSCIGLQVLLMAILRYVQGMLCRIQLLMQYLQATLLLTVVLLMNIHAMQENGYLLVMVPMAMKVILTDRVIL